MRIRTLWTCCAAAVLAVAAGALWRRPAVAAPPLGRGLQTTPQRAAEDGFAAWRGVNSCTSSACHNRDDGRTTFARGSEYAVWSARDPHSRAYEALFDKRSRAIQQRLDKTVTADRNLLCLRCHVDPAAARTADAAPVWFGDGVGCESCHGPAGGWLTVHVGRAWDSMTPDEKQRLGFHDMKDLTGRARACTDCHVGGGRAEVNHDLIAAGHPALLFEFSSFLDRYRPYQHWSEADDRRRHPAFEAEAWAVGQAVSAGAAMKLLKARAAGRGPWPEFAEYDCLSCHHDLKPRTREPLGGHAAGLPAWSWYTALTPLLPEALPGRDSDDLFKALRGEMEKRSPDRAAVAGKAEALAAAYDEWLSRHGERAPDAEALRDRLLRLTGADGQRLAGGGWEAARQLFLAIAAEGRSDAAGLDPPTAAAIRSLVERLAPPPGRDTPPDFDAPDAINDLQTIRKRLRRE